MKKKFKSLTKSLIVFNCLTILCMILLLSCPNWVHTDGDYDFTGNLFKITEGNNIYEEKFYSTLRADFCRSSDSNNFAWNSCETFKRLEYGMYIMVGICTITIILPIMNILILNGVFEFLEFWYSLAVEAVNLGVYILGIVAYKQIIMLSYSSSCAGELCSNHGALLALFFCVFIAFKGLVTSLAVIYYHFKTKNPRSRYLDGMSTTSKIGVIELRNEGP